VYWLDDGTGTPLEQISNLYSTLTLGLGAVEELFSSDPEVDKFYYDKAVATLVTGNASAIAASKQSLRVAEGLDPLP
jgi:hypothetical protein